MSDQKIVTVFEGDFDKMVEGCENSLNLVIERLISIRDRVPSEFRKNVAVDLYGDGNLVLADIYYYRPMSGSELAEQEAEEERVSRLEYEKLAKRFGCNDASDRL